MPDSNTTAPRLLDSSEICRFLAASSPESFAMVRSLAEAVDARGGIAYLVGGAVRDAVLGIPPKDFDLEIHRMSYDAVKDVISAFGTVFEVGKSFGVLKLVKGVVEIDVALPRRDSKSGPGHRGFSVETDSEMGIENAMRRRDFTLNSIAFDVLRQSFCDPFRGMSDLSSRTLRITDPQSFAEDPLRVYRAVQFVARFGLSIESSTLETMRSMLDSLSELPKERIWEEWRKLVTKSPKPSLGLVAAKEIGLISRYYPELDALESTPQDPVWHPEGNVWIHTLLALDEAAESVSGSELSDESALAILFGTLCHDLGKPATTDASGPRITSRNHEARGENPTRSFLSCIGAPSWLIERVVPLVTNHLAPSSYFESEKKGIPVSDGAIRRLAKRLHPANIGELVILAGADFHGRGDEMRSRDYLAGAWLLKRADALSVDSRPPKNAMSGKELMALGIEPGKRIGEIIAYANALRDDEGLDKVGIVERITEEFLS